MQLSRDAYHQKAPFPFEILSEQIHIPVRQAQCSAVHDHHDVYFYYEIRTWLLYA